jgi:hypothetical protein
LPAAGEIVLFDRIWYNRAGVKHVMGFCSDEEYREFLRACPLFEDMLVRSGIYLVKYWFSVNDEEQEARFAERMQNPIKRWKLSPMDLEARKHWVEYSRAKDEMLEFTDTKRAPWHIVDADNKKRARLNCIAHLLRQIPYKDLQPVILDLPNRQPDLGYKRPKKSQQRWVRLPEVRQVHVRLLGAGVRRCGSISGLPTALDVGRALRLFHGECRGGLYRPAQQHVPLSGDAQLLSQGGDQSHQS